MDPLAAAMASAPNTKEDPPPIDALNLSMDSVPPNNREDSLPEDARSRSEQTPSTVLQSESESASSSISDGSGSNSESNELPADPLKIVTRSGRVVQPTNQNCETGSKSKEEAKNDINNGKDEIPVSEESDDDEDTNEWMKFNQVRIHLIKLKPIMPVF
ncbi:hypothetical protein PtA15_12A560 [Puccinia triticina]|uniref:Uncharacterized protein n=1 Tax=Puccinia triticina TaxID=208348 RepID=A0ABY7D0Y7_9BASI|nr:uncharacterized protein PtA15_12A560 [Puccinia triticina]WAQ90570.1 hypothetical protein PtA15_12A560 [Puccinia triticina]